MTSGIERFIETIILYLSVIVFLLILLKRTLPVKKKDKFGYLLILFNISIMTSMIIAIIEAPLSDPTLNALAWVLLYISNSLMNFACICFLLSLIVLYDGQNKFKNHFQLFFVVSGILIFQLLFLIPDSVRISSSENSIQAYPIYSFPYAIANAVYYGTCFVFFMFISIKIMKKIENEEMIKKFKMYSVSFSILFITLIIIAIDNWAIHLDYFGIQVGNLIFKLILGISLVSFLAMLYSTSRK